MFSLEILGVAAGCVSTISFIPQIYKTWKTKSAEGLSIQMLIICAIAISLWTVYGKILNKVAIYVPNFIILILITTQITLKLKYDKTNKAKKTIQK
jgi:MtN3 and saliva related transmembrane protein